LTFDYEVANTWSQKQCDEEQAMTMTISLTPELEKLINEKVQSGEYASASEVIREGLRLLEEQEELRRIKYEALKHEVDIGVAQIERGEGLVYNSSTELADEIKNEARNTQQARGKE
jgi:antitoxin ParD1/3/4